MPILYMRKPDTSAYLPGQKEYVYTSFWESEAFALQ